jgi:SAM-dependent methyltransferase
LATWFRLDVGEESLFVSEIYKELVKFAKGIAKGSRVLDVGCGLKPYESLFSHCSYIGIDVEKSGRESEGKKMDYEFDGINIPFSSNSFDIVICTQVLEHAVHADELIKDIRRVLKIEGELFLTVPFIWGRHELPYDFRRYTDIGIKKLLNAYGFDVIESKKLTEGVDAIKILLVSEINNYINNTLSKKERNSFKFRVIFRIQNFLLRLLYYVWRRNFVFERIYIDNMVVAKKRD